MDVPEEDERDAQRAFRERLRLAIPFFGTIRVEPPILIPPYREELMALLSSTLERGLADYLETMVRAPHRDELRRISEEWEKAVHDLEGSPPYGTDGGSLVELFSNLTQRGFDALSRMASVASGFKTIRRLLLEQTPRPHLRELPEVCSDLLQDVDETPWLKRLAKLRRRKPLQNATDAFAVALVVRLNKDALHKGRKELFLLLSDAPVLERLLGDPAGPGGDLGRELGSFVHSEQFPEDLRTRGVRLLRTSYHFEEFLGVYLDEDRGDSLLSRAVQLRNMRPTTDQAADVLRYCEESGGKPNCQRREECEQVMQRVATFLDQEHHRINLDGIAAKQVAFGPLLDLTSESLRGMGMPHELSGLEAKFTAFFSEKYEDEFLGRLTSKLEEYFTDSFDHLAAIAEDSLPLSDTPVLRLWHRLSRSSRIVFSVAFRGSEAIEQLLSEINSLAQVPLGLRSFPDWYRRLMRVVAMRPSDPHAALLSAMLLYCHELYDDASWLCGLWLTRNEKRTIIEQTGKVVEFKYISASADSRMCYTLPNRSIAVEELRRIVSGLRALAADHPDDPRLPHLIGKICGRVWQFGIDKSDAPLLESITESRKAMGLLETETGVEFGELRTALVNNMLYCLCGIESPSQDQLREACSLREMLMRESRKATFVETLAAYDHMCYRLAQGVDARRGHLLSAIQQLGHAVTLANEQYANRQDVASYRGELSEWRKELRVEFGGEPAL
jgi:hypothetical protein